jgi:putative membrane protein
LFVIAIVAFEQTTLRQGSSGGNNTVLLIVLGCVMAVIFVLNFIRYLVTRWALDGSTLRIETGLLKRDARQLPLTRIQAVDIVRPFLARAAGLSELRIRLAGGSSRAGGRLAYLSEAAAVDLRDRLLAGHHGLDQSTPPPPERFIASVSTAELVTSAVLSAVATLVIGWAFILTVVLLTASSGTATGVGATTFLLTLIGFGRNTWRRVATMYGFTVGLAPDGIHIKRGLLSTVSETVPLSRVQAVRKVEPLAWRLFGWCRLEVDVAGSPGDEGGSRNSRVTKSLLPVGRYQVADELFSSLLGLRQFPLQKPPRRAFWKAPLSYHFLASGCDGSVVASSTGRLRKVTAWVPLEKSQSVRRAQGPVQRLFHLATVHVDAAGRRARAELRDRDEKDADALFEQLVVQSRAARRRASGPPRPMAPAAVTPAAAMGPPPPAPPPGHPAPSWAALPAHREAPVSGIAPPPEGTKGWPGPAVPTDPWATGQPAPPPATGNGGPGSP